MKFQQLINTMLQFHEIPLGNELQIVGRVKAMGRAGWPEGVNAGKGQRVSYTLEQLADIYIVLELASLGITQQRAIEIAELNRSAIFEAIQTGGEVTIKVPRVFGEARSRWHFRLRVPNLLSVWEGFNPPVNALPPRQPAEPQPASL